jgi:hypothetical protein
VFRLLPEQLLGGCLGHESLTMVRLRLVRDPHRTAGWASGGRVTLPAIKYGGLIVIFRSRLIYVITPDSR